MIRILKYLQRFINDNAVLIQVLLAGFLIGYGEDGSSLNIAGLLLLGATFGGFKIKA